MNILQQLLSGAESEAEDCNKLGVVLASYIATVDQPMPMGRLNLRSRILAEGELTRKATLCFLIGVAHTFAKYLGDFSKEDFSTGFTRALTVLDLTPTEAKKAHDDASFWCDEEQGQAMSLVGVRELSALGEDGNFGISTMILGSLVAIKDQEEMDSFLRGSVSDDVVSRVFGVNGTETVWEEEIPGSYRLYLQIQATEQGLGVGMEFLDEERNRGRREEVVYHCKLNTLFLTGGEYPDGLPRGVYEFQIIEADDALDFSLSPADKNQGERFYIDRDLFDRKFVMPLYVEDRFDSYLRNTIGLEKINFG